MKIIHLSLADIRGGAFAAAYRLHHCLREAGVDSWMWVNQFRSGDWTVEGPRNKLEKAMAIIRPQVVRPFVNTLKTANPVLHSPAILPSSWVKRINASDADIVHLHWVQDEMLSIAEIGQIKKTIVWTLHDMWAFCGAEHLAWDSRWRDGYSRRSRPDHESGFDLNRWTWERKRKHWRKHFQVIAPSQGLANSISQSALMKDWPVQVIPNPLDTEIWQPVQSVLARQIFHLPSDIPLLLFGAIGGTADYNKGFDLLQSALGYLRYLRQTSPLELVVFGQREPEHPPDLGFPIHYVGHLHDDLSLRLLYSAVDIMVVPSRQEAFCQTASEAHACGTPVVAFNIGGLPDIVEHQRTGYLAPAFDTQEFANGIQWVLAQRQTGSFGKHARARAVERFSYPVVAAQYQAVYQQAIEHLG